MITIYHGEDTVKSRNAYVVTKAKYPNAVVLEGTKLTLADLKQKMSGDSLFSDAEKVVCIEDLLSKRKASKETDALLAFLAKENDTPIFLWESKELTQKQLASLGKVSSQKFDIPHVLFTFLDSLRPGNTHQTLILFHQLCETEAPEFVMTMIVRQIRLLLAVSQVSRENIDEVTRMAPWQRGKLEKQAKLFSTERLLSLHHALFEADLAQKTGKLSQPLGEHIDLILLKM